MGLWKFNIYNLNSPRVVQKLTCVITHLLIYPTIVQTINASIAAQTLDSSLCARGGPDLRSDNLKITLK